jgi:hypothetical protein
VLGMFSLHSPPLPRRSSAVRRRRGLALTCLLLRMFDGCARSARVPRGYSRPYQGTEQVARKPCPQHQRPVNNQQQRQRKERQLDGRCLFWYGRAAQAECLHCLGDRLRCGGGGVLLNRWPGNPVRSTSGQSTTSSKGKGKSVSKKGKSRTRCLFWYGRAAQAECLHCLGDRLRCGGGGVLL